MALLPSELVGTMKSGGGGGGGGGLKGSFNIGQCMSSAQEHSHTDDIPLAPHPSPLAPHP